jgi:putative transposase
MWKAKAFRYIFTPVSVMDFKRKVNRVDLEFYRQKRIYFLTICCFNGQEILRNEQIVNELLKKLMECCKTHEFTNYVYCFMPDHVHLLLGGEEGSDLIKMVKQFKQLTGYSFKKETGERLWQKSYYDHILRKEEDVVKIVRYILENPVRKGLTKHPEEYQFSGSLEFGKEIFKM